MPCSTRPATVPHVGDVFMSLIHTLRTCAGPIRSTTSRNLERHADELSANPQDWMPWNYRENAERDGTCPNAVRRKLVKKTDAAERLRKALAKRTKSELIDVLVELAGDDREHPPPA